MLALYLPLPLVFNLLYQIKPETMLVESVTSELHLSMRKSHGPSNFIFVSSLILYATHSHPSASITTQGVTMGFPDPKF